MTRQIVRFLAPLALFLCAFVVIGLAQDPDDIQQGIKAYGTYEGGEFDSVSMTNGNLVLNIPLVSYPQRGKLHFGYYLRYARQAVVTSKTILCPLECTTEVIVSPGNVGITDDVSFGGKTTTVPIPDSNEI
jgi:hypothetical protein